MCEVSNNSFVPFLDWLIPPVLNASGQLINLRYLRHNMFDGEGMERLESVLREIYRMEYGRREVRG